MNVTSKILAWIYFILSLGWFGYGFFMFFVYQGYFPRTPLIALLGILVGLVGLFLGFVHWNVSDSILGVRERFLVLCSSITVILIFLTILFNNEIGCRDEGCMIVLPTMFFLAISSFLTVILGVASIFKINKRILSWVMFLIIILLVFLEIMNVLVWS